MQSHEGFDVLEGDPLGESWGHRWRSLSRGVRAGAVCLVAAAVLAAAVLGYRSWAAGRAADREVRLSVTLGVSSSSTTPLGGQVEYFVTVRNDGLRPTTVEELASVGSGMDISGSGPLRIEAADEALLPLSVLLTCDPAPAPDGTDAGAGPRTLAGQVSVVREDGGTTTSDVLILAPEPLLDAAATLCSARPELRSYQLSGPTVR
ncbi:hypothetical protein GB931_05625 [Modestobacter sp. I12A-02628]|uniref:DUF11 domain-containing protein n=1 Tax=Goekera deserti TaxID=2497753 RepID=A0A7K3WBH9_9ACTN|nr:hypothetical protein [Goekera deserti]MPQ97413.1 hypothetical protein [Goekera deserti]NDI47986.1 hypothetical protein [Goekera deserti]NEL53734.1 hypothetical protein [Goekera deserti]